MGKAPKYSVEFIIAAIKEVENGKPVQEVADVLGTSKNAIYRWIKRAKQGRYPGFTLREDFEITAPPKYSDEFKIAAVRRVEAGESRAEVAREVKVAQRSLNDWCIEFRSPGFDSERGADEARRILNDARDRDAQRMEAEAQAERAREREWQGTEVRVRQMMADPLIWMQKYSKTKDSHWREHGADSPYRHFPDKPYFRPLMEGFQENPVIS